MVRLTRGEAIRAKCLDCCCGSAYEVRLCPCSDCALYRYRLGREVVDGCNDTLKDENAENGSTVAILEEETDDE